MPSTTPETWLLLKRIVRFGDTDAAGVMHFSHLFRWSHEAWEESLECFGVPSHNVFPGCKKSGEDPNIILPIVHCEADFFRPIKTGDYLDIQLWPEQINSSSFQTKVIFLRNQEKVALSVIRHLSISAFNRKTCNLPECIELWLGASSLSKEESVDRNELFEK